MASTTPSAISTGHSCSAEYPAAAPSFTHRSPATIATSTITALATQGSA